MNNFEEEEYTKGIDLSLWKKLIKYALVYKKQFYFLIFLNIIIALIDVGLPLLTKYAIDEFIVAKNYSNIYLFVGFYLALIAIFAFTIFQFVATAGFLEAKIVYSIRKDGFKKMQELSFSYYDKTPVGWVIARMGSDAQLLGDFISWSFVDIVYSITLIIFIYVVMFTLSVKLTLVGLIVIPILVLATIYFQSKILKGHRESRKINSKITGNFAEGINGAKTTKVLVREDENFNEFKANTSLLKRTNLRVIMYNAVYGPIITILGSAGLALLFSAGGAEFLGGAISMGAFFAILRYMMQIFDPIRQLANILSEMQNAQASGERTFSLLETEPDIVDSEHVIEKYGDSINPRVENFEPIKGEIEFRDVSFTYKKMNTNREEDDEGNKPSVSETTEVEHVLKNFNLKIKQGEKIALVGPTGAGKSTIVNLICRFYEPTGGEILIDGVNYKERSQYWLQSQLGYVLQSPFLFSGTVKDNIKYSKLDATDDEVFNVAKAVDAYDFITNLENGFDTNVGEGGDKLSSGEKQLISFARAIIGEPKIFVLDEATASIDTETEQTIQNAIEKVLEGRTSFIVAHRLSTIKNADRILVIVDGGVLESGTHKELIKKKGYYYDLYTNQFKEEARARILQ